MNPPTIGGPTRTLSPAARRAQIAQRFGVDPGSVQRISRPYEVRDAVA